MSKISFYLFDNGPPKNIPGFKEGILISSFPFWGDYLFIDFTMVNWGELLRNGNNLYLVADGVQDRALLDISERLHLDSFEIIKIDKGIETILQSIHSNLSDYVLLGYASVLSIVNASAILKIIEDTDDAVIKFSINKVPIDLYACKRKNLERIIRKNKHIFFNKENIINEFFNKILLPYFSTIKDIDGMLFFQNNLMQIYRAHMWFIQNGNTELLLEFQNKLNSTLYSKAEALITTNGYVRNSALSSKDEISGFVENSIIFPDVKIGKNAKIHNSLIMNGNTVGENAVLYNTVVFPHNKDRLLHGNTIGEGVQIGSSKSSSKNNNYPEQINSGITVIGYNPEIPDGYEIEAGCYIAPDTPFDILRERRKLTKGKSIIEKELKNGF